MADWQQRTEAPTPRRREEARQRGQVAVSHDLSGGLTLLFGALALKMFGQHNGTRLLSAIRRWLEQAPPDLWTPRHTTDLGWQLVEHTWRVCGGVVLVVLAVGSMVHYLQAGPGLSWKQLALDWEKLSPARGLQRLWSGRSVVRAVLAVLKAVAIAAAVLAAIRVDLETVRGASEGSLWQAVAVGWDAVVRVAVVVGVSLVALGLVDFAYQRWRHEQQLRMTRQDLKEERRQDEGDPHVRARIKKLQREMNKKMLAEVPKATVVLTNPTHLAVALQYDRQTMDAPVVVAKGAQLRARRIVELAREAGVPVLERKPLAQALYRQVEVGQPIPPDLYRAVAEVLAYLYRLRRAAA